jgi:hypothetical protein
MVADSGHLTLEVNVRVEAREGHWAATVEQFPVTVYGDSQQAAENRALEALTMLLGRHMESPEVLSNYLSARGVLHFIEPAHLGGAVQSYRRKLRVPVGV